LLALIWLQPPAFALQVPGGPSAWLVTGIVVSSLYSSAASTSFAIATCP
jgi:hypothetical protein